MKFSVAGEHFEVDEGSVTFGEARDLEKETGLTFGQVAVQLREGSATAIQGLVWLAMRRQKPNLTFDDLDKVVIDSIEFQEEKETPDPTGAAGSTVAASKPSRGSRTSSASARGKSTG